MDGCDLKGSILKLYNKALRNVRVLENIGILICICLTIGLIDILISLNVTTQHVPSDMNRNHKRVDPSEQELIANESENCLKPLLNTRITSLREVFNYTLESNSSISELRNSCKYFDFLSLPDPRVNDPPFTYRYHLKMYIYFRRVFLLIFEFSHLVFK